MRELTDTTRPLSTVYVSRVFIEICEDRNTQSLIESPNDVGLSGMRCGTKMNFMNGMMKYKMTSISGNLDVRQREHVVGLVV